MRTRGKRLANTLLPLRLCDGSGPRQSNFRMYYFCLVFCFFLLVTKVIRMYFHRNNENGRKRVSAGRCDISKMHYCADMNVETSFLFLDL